MLNLLWQGFSFSEHSRISLVGLFPWATNNEYDLVTEDMWQGEGEVFGGQWKFGSMVGLRLGNKSRLGVGWGKQVIEGYVILH